MGRAARCAGSLWAGTSLFAVWWRKAACAIGREGAPESTIGRMAAPEKARVIAGEAGGRRLAVPPGSGPADQRPGEGVGLLGPRPGRLVGARVLDSTRQRGARVGGVVTGGGGGAPGGAGPGAPGPSGPISRPSGSGPGRPPGGRRRPPCSGSAARGAVDLACWTRPTTPLPPSSRRPPAAGGGRLGGLRSDGGGERSAGSSPVLPRPGVTWERCYGDTLVLFAATEVRSDLSWTALVPGSFDPVTYGHLDVNRTGWPGSSTAWSWP